MKTEVCKLKGKGNDFSLVEKIAEKTAVYNDLDKKQGLQLRLLSEELVGMLPELVKNFAVSFELEHGEVLTLCVPEEYYGAFEIGQEGKLTLASEQFVSFEAENCENK